MPSDLWGFVTLIVTGFTACAEFGSYAFVHPVIRRLPPEHHIRVEQGLLRTFGRWMPFAMTLCVVLSVAYAVMGSQAGANPAHILAAALFVLALISTLIFNVPVNLATRRWDADAPPPDWQRTRNRWEFFQGVRSWLLLAGFIVVAAAITR
jgi:uncharacterized membrane protein